MHWDECRPYQLLRIPYPYIYMLGCVCKTACIRNCECKNAGLKCTTMCSGYGGRIWNNNHLNGYVVWVQPFSIIPARNVAALVDFNSFSESHTLTQSFTPLPWVGAGFPQLLKNHWNSDLFQDHGKTIEFQENLLKFAKNEKKSWKIIELWSSHPWTNHWILKQT